MSDDFRCSCCGAQRPGATSPGRCDQCRIEQATKPDIATAETLPPTPGSGSDRRPHSLSPVLRSFGDYDLLEEIARGGMGVVYRARQRSLNRVVALKMILAGNLASDEDVRRFRAEAEAAAGLSHPNLVAIHEVGEFHGQHFYSMEFIRGRSLAQVVRDGALPPARAALYVKKAAEAVHYVHRQGILHRDLKPSNILIDEFDQPRIADFGLAKRLDVDHQLTRTGASLGTPAYMPPEQIASRKGRIGPACDVYALGAILFEMLAGRPVFTADTAFETMRLVLEQPAPSLRSIAPDAPHDLEAVCAKCLEKSPTDRYASAQLLAEDLGRFLDELPVQAPIAAEALACAAPPAPRSAATIASATPPIAVPPAPFPAPGPRAPEWPAARATERPAAPAPLIGQLSATPSTSNAPAVFAGLTGLAAVLAAAGLGWLPCLGLIALVPALSALGFGFAGIRRAKAGARHRGVAWGGAFLGLIAMPLAIGLQYYGGSRIGSWLVTEGGRVLESEFEWVTLGSQWRAPAQDIADDQLFPLTVGLFQRASVDREASLPELGIDLPGRRAIYSQPGGRRVEIFAYSATPLECEGLASRLKEILHPASTGAGNSFGDNQQTPDGLRAVYGEGARKMHRWETEVGADDGVFWWGQGWFIFARSVADPGGFLKSWLQALPQ